MSRGDGMRAAVLNACVLVPIRLTMTLLALAEAGCFEVLWSETILWEVERSLPRVGLTPQAAARRVHAMREGFGTGAMVDGFDRLIDEMRCDVKDRHVLAAAVAGDADTVVTFNLRDFPEESTASLGIEVQHPDRFLTRLLMEDTQHVLAATDAITGRLQHPPMSGQDFLASLTTTAPVFANQAADAALHERGPTSPLPALVTAEDRTALAAFGEPGVFTNPAQVGLAFWTGLLEDLDLARDLTHDPEAWGDYVWARDMVAGRSLTSKVIRAVDAPGNVAFMRFVPEVAQTSKVFASYATEAVILTLLRHADGSWRAWGLGPRMPSAREVVLDLGEL